MNNQGIKVNSIHVLPVSSAYRLARHRKLRQAAQKRSMQKFLNVDNTTEISTSRIHMQCRPVRNIIFTHVNDSLEEFCSKADRTARESADVDKQTQKLLFNNKFIETYMRLNQHEKQVLKQLSLMKTSEQIASALLVSVNHVKNHRENIDQKLRFTTCEEHNQFLFWVRGYVS